MRCGDSGYTNKQTVSINLFDLKLYPLLSNCVTPASKSLQFNFRRGSGWSVGAAAAAVFKESEIITFWIQTVKEQKQKLRAKKYKHQEIMSHHPMNVD